MSDRTVIKVGKEDTLIVLWVKYPNAAEIYQDENGIFWMDKQTAKRQGKHQNGTVTIYKRKDRKIK